MKRNRKFVCPANANVHTFHPEVVKVLFVLLYGPSADIFRPDVTSSFEHVASTVEHYSGRAGFSEDTLPYIAVNPALNEDARFAFQRLGLNLKRMQRMNALLASGGEYGIGYDILDVDCFVELYMAILFDLRDLRVL